MYANAPPEVVLMKAMFEASATWTAMSGTIHYPSASTGDSASADTLPLIVIEPVKDNPKVLAPGIVLPGGTIQVILHMLTSAGADIEKKARAIKDEIMLMPTGLPLLSGDVGMSELPSPGERASQQYSDENSLNKGMAVTRIPIIFTFGIT